MRVRLVRPRRFMDAGVERPLDAGQTYDLPDVVARSLIATGAAVAEEPPAPPDEAVQTSAQRPPETKPLPRLETKRTS